MNNQKQILILIGGVVLAAVLIFTSLKSDKSSTDITPTSQKKPKQNTPALLDILS